jgi:hypothetical protein
LGFDERGKVWLSMKVVDQQTGEDLEAKQKAEGEPPRESTCCASSPAAATSGAGGFGCAAASGCGQEAASRRIGSSRVFSMCGKGEV